MARAETVTVVFTDLAEAAQLGMVREVVRLQRLQAALLNSAAGQS